MKIIEIGTGYIGISSCIYFSKANIDVIGIDTDNNKISLLQNGELPQKDLLKWMGFDVADYLKRCSFYDNYSPLYEQQNVDAILIAIPTEKDGLPYFNILESVISEIKKSPLKDTLVIIESTLTPGVCEKYVEPHLKNFAVCPRRDWFTDKDKTLATLPRIVGGYSEVNTKKAVSILESICQTLLPCNFKEAELVKAVENSLRHVGAVYATELAYAYPNLDTRKILKYASTKWNVSEYYPNIMGTSGYCIPVSSKYVKLGAEFPNTLNIIESAIQTDNNTAEIIASLLKENNIKNIGILGMAYLGDIKVHVECGCLKLLKYFDSTDNIKINDPLYNKEEIKNISGREFFIIPDDLEQFDALIITAGHSFYQTISKEKIIEKTKNMKFILDNSENSVWSNIEFKCPYTVTGGKNWLDIFKGTK